MSTAYTRMNFDDVEDIAAKHGMGDMGESRHLRADIGAESVGASLYRMNPGKRLGFGHRHDEVEELYVVVSGTGRIKVDDDILDLKTLDAVRLAPSCVREVEAGPDGMTLIAFGSHVEGDGSMVQGFWTD